jgi:hypothetical protein
MPDLANFGRFTYVPQTRIVPDGRGRSSGVERNLAKVEVEGSNPFARSKIRVIGRSPVVDLQCGRRRPVRYPQRQ